MADKKQLQKYFDISDKEWNQMSAQEKKTKKRQYQHDYFIDVMDKASESRRNADIDLQTNIYGNKRISNKKVRDTLNKAGYNIKQDTSAAQRFKDRYLSK
tara:strand:- start:276 stop:575 length:300 start_codon:yes stop_codon:yes gene_type:complete